MDVFGFQESIASAETALLPANVEISMVALPALALLKLVAWEDRHRRAPGKDAADLSLIMRSYLAVSANAQRLWSEFVGWTESADFDYERGGARMLGHDMRQVGGWGGAEEGWRYRADADREWGAAAGDGSTIAGEGA